MIHHILLIWKFCPCLIELLANSMFGRYWHLPFLGFSPFFLIDSPVHILWYPRSSPFFPSSPLFFDTLPAMSPMAFSCNHTPSTRLNQLPDGVFHCDPISSSVAMTVPGLKDLLIPNCPLLVHESDSTCSYTSTCSPSQALSSSYSSMSLMASSLMPSPSTPYLFQVGIEKVDILLNATNTKFTYETGTLTGFLNPKSPCIYIIWQYMMHIWYSRV